MAYRKKVGKVDSAVVITVALGAVALIGLKTITGLLEQIGLFKSAAAKDYEQELKNPYSFWNPLFWTKGPVGTLGLTMAYCEWLYNEIDDSFSFWGDNEDRIYAAFHTLTTQSQLSFFSQWVQDHKRKNLLSWLIGGNVGPWGDHLSASEINKITGYIERLPKYKK